MKKKQTSKAVRNLTIFVFCIIKLREIIGVFQGLDAYRETGTFQALETLYIVIHQEMIRLQRLIKSNDPDIQQLLQLLSSSELNEHKTLIWHKEYALNSLLEDELESGLTPLMSHLRFVMVTKNLHFPQPPCCYALSQNNRIEEVTQEMLDSAKHAVNEKIKDSEFDIDLVSRYLDINVHIQDIIGECKKEMISCHEELFGTKKPPSKLQFDTESGTVLFNSQKIGEIKPGTQPFFFFKILHENIGKYVSIDQIIAEISSIDQKRSFSEGKAGFCSTIKGKLPHEVNRHIHSCKGMYMLSEEKKVMKHEG